MNEIEALTEFYTAAVDSLKAKLAEAERQNKAMREVLESVAQLAPDFLDNEDGHFSKAVAEALSTASRPEWLKKIEEELKAPKQWHGTPPKGEVKDIRARLESCCTPEIIKYYEELKEDE